MMNTDVVRLSLSQMNQAIEILAYAFNADPMFCYFYAEAEQARLNTLRWLSKMVLHYSQPYNFYQRHGFEVVRTGQASANAPRFWMMKRDPTKPQV